MHLQILWQAFATGKLRAFLTTSFPLINFVNQFVMSYNMLFSWNHHFQPNVLEH